MLENEGSNGVFPTSTIYILSTILCGFVEYIVVLAILVVRIVIVLILIGRTDRSLYIIVEFSVYYDFILLEG